MNLPQITLLWFIFALIALSRLIGIAGATYGYHVGEKCAGPAKLVVHHSPNVVLYVDCVVEFRLEVIFMAPGIAISRGKFATIIWIYAIATPEPTIYELVFVQDGLKIFPDVFNHASVSPPVLFVARLPYG